jgi:hypothetical protein
MKITTLCVLSVLFVSCARSQTEPKAMEVWEPKPKVIEAVANIVAPPSDAIVLFNGSDFSSWVGNNNEVPKWKLENNAMTIQAGTGAIRTKQSFGSCQMHIEWKSPSEVNGEGQHRGNSGIFLMGRYELQILDSYNNITFSNGQAGSIYKQHIPLVNACRPPGEWQSFDIIFTAPVFKPDGSIQNPARFTVHHNGVLIHNNVELLGTTVNEGTISYKKHESREPISLQDHSAPVSFRNIWIRDLDNR